MIQHLIDLLPDKVTQMPSGAAMGIAAGGILLGLVGARLSRAILALALVAAGTIIGLRMPGWFGWKIDPMGTAFGAAILLGLSGFVLSTLWEGILFGSLLALGAGIAVWQSLAPGIHWQQPDIDPSATAVEIFFRLWHALPSAVSHALPIGSGLGFAIGVMLLATWPRLGRALLYSLLGMLLFVLGGAIGLQTQHADWLARISQESWTQGTIFISLITITTAVQFSLTAPPKKAKPVPAPSTTSGKAPEKSSDPKPNIRPDNAAVSPSKSPSPPSQSPSPSPLASPKISPPPPPKWATIPPAAGESRQKPPAARPPNNPNARKQGP